MYGRVSSRVLPIIIWFILYWGALTRLRRSFVHSMVCLLLICQPPIWYVHPFSHTLSAFGYTILLLDYALVHNIVSIPIIKPILWAEMPTCEITSNLEEEKKIYDTKSIHTVSMMKKGAQIQIHTFHRKKSNWMRCAPLIRHVVRYFLFHSYLFPLSLSFSLSGSLQLLFPHSIVTLYFVTHELCVCVRLRVNKCGDLLALPNCRSLAAY